MNVSSLLHFYHCYSCPRFSLVAQMVKNPPAMRETWVRSRVGKITWSPLQFSCLENPHGQRSLVGCCSPWGHKESNMTERLNWTELKQVILMCWNEWVFLSVLFKGLLSRRIHHRLPSYMQKISPNLFNLLDKFLATWCSSDREARAGHILRLLGVRILWHSCQQFCHLLMLSHFHFLLNPVTHAMWCQDLENSKFEAHLHFLS